MIFHACITPQLITIQKTSREQIKCDEIPVAFFLVLGKWAKVTKNNSYCGKFTQIRYNCHILFPFMATQRVILILSKTKGQTGLLGGLKWRRNNINFHTGKSRGQIHLQKVWLIEYNHNIPELWNAHTYWWFRIPIWVRSRNCGCLVTWFCYQLIAKPGNKTATVLWPDPYAKIKREHCGYGFSQWDTMSHCNVVSHWLSP